MKSCKFSGWLKKKPVWIAAVATLASVVAGIGATAPYYMPIEPGAFSEYASVSTLKMPFGVEIIKRATVRLSIEKSETHEDESFVWVKIDTKAGEEGVSLAARLKSSALASLPALSDDLNPFVEVLESISAAKLWLNGELVKEEQEVKPPELKGALGILGAFLDLKVSPSGKARLETPAGKISCEWYEMKARAASPEGLKSGGARMEFSGRFCLSREVPFRFVKSVYDFKVVVQPPRRKRFTLEGHHESTLSDYGPRETPKASAVRPPALLP
jgi:hypothetical protein